MVKLKPPYRVCSKCGEPRGMEIERCDKCGTKRARTVRNWKHEIDEEVRRNPEKYRVKSFWDLSEQQRAAVAMTFVKALQNGYTVQMTADELFYDLGIPYFESLSGMFNTFSSVYYNAGLRAVDPNWYQRRVPSDCNLFTGKPWGHRQPPARKRTPVARPHSRKAEEKPNTACACLLLLLIGVFFLVMARCAIGG
jgi:hypothetical protein